MMASKIPSSILYLLAIVIWGSTWYGIKVQTENVSPAVSVVYRFALAALLLLSYMGLRRHRMAYSSADHMRFLMQGVCLYSTTYILAYYAGRLIPSGLNAVLFSTLVLFNVFNAALFLKSPLSMRSVVGAIIGLAGLGVIFLQEFLWAKIDWEVIVGMSLSLLGGYLSSIGNIFSAKTQSTGIPVLHSNAFAMGYGALVAVAYCVLTQQQFTIDVSVRYLGSLLYMVVFGSIITFGCYLTLVGRYGPERAGYPMLLVPVVAMTFSIVLEGVAWDLSMTLGVIMIILGNVIMKRPPTVRP